MTARTSLHIVPSLDQTLEERLRKLSLGPEDLAGLTLHSEATSLVLVGIDYFDREAYLAPSAADAWIRMREAAARSGLDLLLISAFRSHARQAILFQRKLEQGWQPKDILCIIAPPGYSEHHTGRAVDLGAPDHTELTETFESSAEFRWLGRNAADFGFSMSYPRDNPLGIQYEPWHWLHGPA